MEFDSEAAALVDLWDDPDQEVSAAVRKRLEDLGRPALSALHKLRSSDEAERRLRAAEATQWLHLQTFMPLWAYEVQKTPLNLERSLLLLSLFRDPLLDVSAYREKLDRMADSCPVLSTNRSTSEAAITLIDHFSDTLQFRQSDLLTDPNAVFLSSVIDQRRGHSLALGTLFLLLSRRLSLPFALSVSTAGNFLLYPLESRILLFEVSDDFALIDQSDWSRNRLVAGASPGAITPTATDDRTLLLMILREAHARVQRSGDERSASELEDLLTIAEPVER